MSVVLPIFIIPIITFRKGLSESFDLCFCNPSVISKVKNLLPDFPIMNLIKLVL